MIADIQISGWNVFYEMVGEMKRVAGCKYQIFVVVSTLEVEM